MTTETHRAHLFTTLLLAAVLVPGTAPRGLAKEKQMQRTARGAFDVEMKPESERREAGGNVLGRFALVKNYEGDLSGTASGELLTARSSTEGSAGYVALEHVTGNLGGRRGTFVLQHSGTMAASGERLDVLVVPDSGTGELEGLDGRLSIEVVDDEHRYELVYTLPED